MTYTGKSGQQYQSQYDAEEDFLSPRSRLAIGTNRPAWQGANATQTQYGVGGYDTTGFVNTEQQAAAAANARRRQEEAQRVASQGAIDAQTRQNQAYRQQQDAYNRQVSAQAPTSYGARRVDPMSYGSQANKQFADQQQARATSLDRQRREYVQSYLDNWRRDPSTYAADSAAPDKGDNVSNWRSEAMSQYQQENSAEEANRRAMAKQWGVDETDAAYAKALKGSSADWRKFQTGTERNLAIKDLGKDAFSGLLNYRPDGKSLVVQKDGSYFDIGGVGDLEDDYWKDIYTKATDRIAKNNQTKTDTASYRRQQALSAGIAPDDPEYQYASGAADSAGWDAFVKRRTEASKAKTDEEARLARDQAQYQRNLAARAAQTAGGMSRPTQSGPRFDFAPTQARTAVPRSQPAGKVFIQGLGYVTPEEARANGY